MLDCIKKIFEIPDLDREIEKINYEIAKQLEELAKDMRQDIENNSSQYCIGLRDGSYEIDRAARLIRYGEYHKIIKKRNGGMK